MTSEVLPTIGPAEAGPAHARRGRRGREGAPLGNVKATRDDWLDLALGVLAAEGVAHVTVLNLSQRLSVSRSSFYWYFRKSRRSARRACLTDGTG